MTPGLPLWQSRASALHLLLRYTTSAPPLAYRLPLFCGPDAWRRSACRADWPTKVRAKEFGADLLAGISLITSAGPSTWLSSGAEPEKHSGGQSVWTAR